MSCQQAARFITNNSNNISKINQSAQTNNNCKILNSNSHNHKTIKGNFITEGIITQEDPYVFTESVPTTPPILFNTQKTRTRLNDLPSATTIGKLQQQKLPLTEANGKITSNPNQIKTQASFLSLTTTTNNSAGPTSKNNTIQSLTPITAKTNSNCNTKKITNVCVVRPQLQTQQQLHYHHQQQQYHNHQNFVNSTSIYEGDLKSISPPPLYTPPTPSLWQTPLLLEATTPTSAKVTNVLPEKPRLITTTSQTAPIMGCVTPTVQTVGSSTTAMAKVAPIIVHALPPTLSPAQIPNQCLPPSKFHNHTLAQHLQKVECLKKSKKPTEAETIFCNDNANVINSPLKPGSPVTLSTTTALKAINNATHVDDSENEDLNEIPVNVIFRMAVPPQTNEKSSNNIQFVKPQAETDIIQLTPQLQQQEQINQKAPSSSTTPIQLATNVNKKFSIPASKTIATKELLKHEQITTSSIIPQQQQEQNETKTTSTIVAASNSQQNQTPNEIDDNVLKIPVTNVETTNAIIKSGDSTTIASNPKRKNVTHISGKTRKLNSVPSTNLNFALSCKWQVGCSTKECAVAIVKISQHNIDLDRTHLGTGLPYCLQQYWLNSLDFCKSSSDLLLRDKSLINRSLAREERIATYKQQLRRQAIQLFSTKCLQKLPLKAAKRRLLCVDRLVRKYEQSERNKDGFRLPANVKICCTNGCDASTLEMASHCQQHIVLNAAQHVFFPCTAKFADNTQCRVPVFDITHDLPLCMEHARKRDAYNRFLYEQRPRKISSNPLAMNESIILTSKLSPGAISMKKENNQNKQHQNILKKLPLNNNNNNNNDNNNSNKRPTLVNQQSRKRKMTVGLTANPVGRPQKRVKKHVEKCVGTLTATITKHQMPHLTSTNLKRKNSTTSLESIASNSQHSTTSCTSQQQKQYQSQQAQQQHLYGVTPTIANNTSSSLVPPALAPLSSGLVGHGLPQHLFSFGHDNNHHKIQQFRPNNIKVKHSFSVSTTPTATASTPTELKDFISQFSFISQKQTQPETTVSDVNLLNTNSNSNFTSSGMGSTTSLPTADDFLTQDMFSICENSSASSADTGLGGLSDPELMLGGPEDDIPLGDTRLLEENDLENVLNSLPEDAFKELFTTVHQDESDEIERAIELADKHLKTLQQTIGSELGDFLDFSDDMLMDNGGLCDGSTASTILDTSALFIGGGNVGSTSIAVGANATQGGGTLIGTDTRGLVQT